MFPRQIDDPKRLLPFARLVSEGSAERLWVGQSLQIESNPALAYLAGAGFSIKVGVGVGLAPLRHPFDAAVQIRSLAKLSGEPVSLAIGASTPELVAALHGTAYEKPAMYVEEYMKVVRLLLEGGDANFNGKYIRNGVSLPPLSTPSVEVGAGVLRPAMARATGRSGQLAVTWLAPASYLKEVLIPNIAASVPAGAEMPRIVAMVPFALARAGVEPGRLVANAALPHLLSEHYTDMLRQAGANVDHAEPLEGIRELLRLGIFSYGDVDAVRETIDSYFEAGADEVVLHTGGTVAASGDEQALRDLEEILDF